MCGGGGGGTGGGASHSLALTVDNTSSIQTEEIPMDIWLVFNLKIAGTICCLTLKGCTVQIDLVQDIKR